MSETIQVHAAVRITELVFNLLTSLKALDAETAFAFRSHCEGLAADAFVRSMAAENTCEGVSTFVEKRKPQFNER